MKIALTGHTNIEKALNISLLQIGYLTIELLFIINMQMGLI